MIKKFQDECMKEQNPKWQMAIRRETDLYVRPNEVRSEFVRDYNRILHCTAYRRLKHKTQVFFAARNDHICTRIEHVGHVAAVSYTIANELGLNTELTNAIALGHDLGHAPFGHAGEEYLKDIVDTELNESFWHERNSLHFVDNVETLRDAEGKEQNLWLSYAVRDGIVCHCGEVDEASIKPRNDACDLNVIKKASEIYPFTWEGCVVKIADKISYIGRDIEDALALNILSGNEIIMLRKILKDSQIIQEIRIPKIRDLTNTFLMHNFVVDLCEHSSPAEGIHFSDRFLSLIVAVKKFNLEYIYNHKRLRMYKNYAKLIITSIYQGLLELYNSEDTIDSLREERKKGFCPSLLMTFEEWLLKYTNCRNKYSRETHQFRNKILYSLDKEAEYKRCILDFISGMTDGYAIRAFNELAYF